MPLPLPSHIGLILPVWTRWPVAIDGLALSMGAMMPDIADALLGLSVRGELGQWMAHSLLGALVLCVPLGMLLTPPVRALLRRIRVTRSYAERLTSTARGAVPLSLFVGALSHVAFDFISHGNFLLLLPWHEEQHWFPAWWYHSWGSIDLLIYREPYPLAPHTLVWVLLSILGAWMFVRLLRPPAPQA